jgi:hypothetical protein
MARIQWVQARMEELLPVPYFHAVFTLPSEMNPFILRNKASCYSILFRAAQETLSELSADSKHLGARTGFILVLHSWGQNLMDHPHVHCIIPAGGFNPKSEKWKKGNGKFLFPVKAMSALFRGKFMDYFKSAVREKSVKMHGLLSPYEEPVKLQSVIDVLYKKKWVTYVKEPFAGAESVVKYLGNYTHRIAISNHRILAFKDGKVTFSWRDYADHNKKKMMTVTTHEFIRRFLLHVVPSGFMRIRHYGILGNRCKAKLLPLCRALIGGTTLQEFEENEVEVDCDNKKEKKKWYEIIQELTGADPRICPHCRKGIMMVVRVIPGNKRQQLHCQQNSS